VLGQHREEGRRGGVHGVEVDRGEEAVHGGARREKRAEAAAGLIERLLEVDHRCPRACDVDGLNRT